MAQRRYSDEARAAALAVLDANDGMLARSAKEAGVPRATLQLWARNRDLVASPGTRQQKRVEAAEVYASIRDKANALLDGALDLMKPEDLAKDSRMLVAVSTVGGTAEDKRARAAGEPTERHDHTVRDLTPDEAVEVARKLRILGGGQVKRSA